MNKLISKAKSVLKKAVRGFAKVRSKINFKKISSIAISVILVLLVAVVGFLLVVRMSGGVPKFAGYMVLRVSSASMEPELNVGDIILTQEVKDVSQLKKGDIITYNGEVGSYAGKLITHKVEVSPYKDDDGEYRLVTRGIAAAFDDPMISAHQVEGKMICKLNILSAAYNFFKTPWGLASAILLIILLFAGEMWNIVKMPADKKQKKTEEDSQENEIDSDEKSECENEEETLENSEISDETAKEKSSENNSDVSSNESAENETDDNYADETSESLAEQSASEENASDGVESEKKSDISDKTSESTEQETSENK